MIGMCTARNAAVLLLSCGLGACSGARAVLPSPNPQPAVVSITSEQPDLSVRVHPAASSLPAPLPCRPPCTIHTAPGDARVVVHHPSQRFERNVELVAGPQRMRVEPRDPTLQSLGWIALGAAVVVTGVGIVAATHFKSDGQPSSPQAPQSSTPQWAKVALTASILTVVPLGLGGAYLLDRGSAMVDVETPRPAASATPHLRLAWSTAF